MCTRATWHGKTVCAHMVPKLNKWQELCGGVYLKAIQGSYSTEEAASAGTHSGGGAIDVSTSYMSTERRTWIMNNARRSLLIGWQRNTITGVWYSHNHAIDPSCPDLSSTARTQVSLYRQGYDGLKGNNSDPGWRGNIDMMWEMYLNRSETTVAVIQSLINATLSTEVFPFPYPYLTNSMYGPSTDGKPWYSGRVASPTRTLEAIQFAIRCIQRKVGITQDGIYGATTVTAVKRWQSSHSLLADGVVGPATWTRMF